MPTEVTVQNLYIFNSTLSKNEDDGAKKILFYYPEHEDENKKILNVGHIEAVICFARNFNANEPCESLRTEKSLQVLFNAEPDFWIVITVSAVCKSKQKSSESPDEPVYCTYNLQEPIYLAVLKHWYHTFQMTVGNMTKLMNDNDPDYLRLMLNKFYSKYLQSTDVASHTFMDMFQGISFLPLDNVIHLYAQSFLNIIENTFQQVHFTMLLYNDSLVWSGLNKRQTQLVYSYILMWVLPEIAKNDNLVKGNLVQQCLPNQLVGRFITNVWAVKTDSWISDLGKVPILRLSDENEQTFKSYRLVMYKAHHSIVCMFVKMENPLTADLYNTLDQFLGTKLHLLSEKMKNAVEKTLASKLYTERPAKFVYFNAMNLAIKNSIKYSNTAITTNRPSEFNLSPDALRVLVDISSQQSWFVCFRLKKLNLIPEVFKLCVAASRGFAKVCEGSSVKTSQTKIITSMHPTYSVMIKTSNDNWVAGRLCNSREIYIVLNQKLTKLYDVDSEIQSLCAQEFGTIFFYD